MSARIVTPGFRDRVFDVVARIPAGRVASYGDVAAALGDRRVARHVGFALAALPADRADVPWHRVVSSRGRVSRRGDGRPSEEQVYLLTSEGVEVDPETGRIGSFAARRTRT